MKRQRIDQLLVARGLAETLEKAQALVMAGVVLANEQRVDKPSAELKLDAVVRIKGESAASRYVGRGGLKLEKALTEFKINVSDFICLDVGASTGGFTDCLLQHNAQKVYAIDAGFNQIDWRLRQDKRVEVRENVNARYLKPTDFPVQFDLVVIDVSFISVTKIFPAVTMLLNETGKIIALIKPQFEVKRDEVGKGGIIRETEKHERVVREVNQAAETNNLMLLGIIESPIRGADGNKEFLTAYDRRQKN